MRMLKMMLCVGVSIMVAGCALREGVPSRVTPPPPAAWAMQEPSNSLTLLDETFSVSDPESSATRKP